MNIILQIPDRMGRTCSVPISEEAARVFNPHGGEALPDRGINHMTIRVWRALLINLRIVQTDRRSRAQHIETADAAAKLCAGFLSETYGYSKPFFIQQAISTINAGEAENTGS